MGLFELFMVAIGLSMDAFAVSLCKGFGMRKLNYNHAAVIAALFGGFQAAMPLIGWLLGRQFEKYITSLDHWISFILLVFIGGKMLLEAIEEGDECVACNDRLEVKELVGLSVATSIDALAVGVSFSFLQVSILPSIVLIGITTFILSVFGVALGNRFGVKYKSKAEIMGGIVLIFIAFKILLEHLNML